MKKLPLWIKCFILCLSGVIFSIVTLSIVTFFRIYEDKEYIIQTNAKNISAYVDVNIVEKLSMVEERFCGTNVAENIWNASNVEEIRSQFHSLWADTTDVLGIYYIDRDGNTYAIGDVSGGLKERKELIETAKKTESYNDIGRTWFYLKTDRGYNSCVLMADMVYINESYSKNILGQMLLYVDADKINKYYANKEAEGEIGIVIIDHSGNVVFSAKDEWLGKNFYNRFEQSATRFSDNNGVGYVYNSYDSEIKGWKNIVYFNSGIIKKQATSLFILILIVAILCLILVLRMSYIIAARIGKPVDDLFRHIKISNVGNVVLPGELSNSETEEIRSIFNALSEKIKQQMEDIYLNEIELKNLKIKAYESQINPHFIFNTLQIVQMLSVLGENDKVGEVITYLGEMMRYNLEDTQTVRVRDEIKIIEDYFKILKLRYQDKFSYKIIIDEELYDCGMLKFTIQPFVENAIKHGFENKKGLWEIVVMGKKINDELVFVIRDNGNGITKEKMYEIKKRLSNETDLQDLSGIGICNVHNRIRLAYGQEYGVDIFCNGSTQAFIHIPFLKKSIEEGETDV